MGKAIVFAISKYIFTKDTKKENPSWVSPETQDIREDLPVVACPSTRRRDCSNPADPTPTPELVRRESEDLETEVATSNGDLNKSPRRPRSWTPYITPQTTNSSEPRPSSRMPSLKSMLLPSSNTSKSTTASSSVICS